MVDTKFCSKCKEEHLVSEFVKDLSKKDGYHSSFKKSNKEIKQNYYNLNKDKFKKYYKSFLERNPNYQLNYYYNKKKGKKIKIKL